MKSLRIMLLAAPLMLGGCSTLSAVNWSSALPWNWFGDTLSVSENGVGNIRGTTPMQEQSIRAGLNDEYRIRSGMKAQAGKVVPFFEGMKENNVMLVINGQSGTVESIDVLDPAIQGPQGVKVGTPFSDIYSKAFGACEADAGIAPGAVSCSAPGNPHIHYIFSGEWQGPEGLMPPDEILKSWPVKRIVWRR